MKRPSRLYWLAAFALATPLASAAPPGNLISVTPRVKDIIGAASLHSMVTKPVGDIKINDSVIRPDLTITGATWSKASYTPPAKLTVTFTVLNDGIAQAGPFHVYCFAAGSIAPLVAFVPAGLKSKQSTTCSFEAQYSAGPLPATAFADYCNEVVEGSETNNAKASAPTLDASAQDFHVLDLWLEYDKGSVVGPLLPDGPVSQPIENAPMLVKARVGYINKVDQKPLDCPINFCIEGKIYKTFNLAIPANGTAEVQHSFTQPGGPHTLQISAASALVDKSPASNKLDKTYTWRTFPKAPYRHSYYAISDYASIGGGSNLKQSINEGRRFGNRMVEHGHPHVYHAENSAVNWDDWAAGAAARANGSDIAYFVGHGNSDGPFYGNKGNDGQTLMMWPGNYKLGRDTGGQPTLRWAVWSACETLYDGVTDQQSINWDGPNLPLNRWFGAFNGLHAIVGMRSLGWQGTWDGGWFGDSGDSRQRASDFINQIAAGTNFSWAWFLANRWCVYDVLERGFESAVLFAVADDTDYSTERFTAPYPDYVGTPTGYYYDTWRIGSPSW